MDFKRSFILSIIAFNTSKNSNRLKKAKDNLHYFRYGGQWQRGIPRLPHHCQGETILMLFTILIYYIISCGLCLRMTPNKSFLLANCYLFLYYDD